LIVLPTNWPPGAWRNPEFVLNTRALENHVNYVAANRVGAERGWRFIGRSKVVDSSGDTVAEASSDQEELLIAELDLSAANNNRIVNVPGQYEIDRLGDRHPELYGLIAQPTSKSHTAD
jgi:predicted amidohydrolase